MPLGLRALDNVCSIHFQFRRQQRFRGRERPDDMRVLLREWNLMGFSPLVEHEIVEFFLG